MTEKEYIKRIGKKIQAKRMALELSPEELANQTDLTRMHIYRIEKGENSMGIGLLRRIAKALKVKISELVDLE